MNRVWKHALAFLVLGTTATACIPDDGGASGGGVPGGYVLVQAIDYQGSLYSSASAFFIAYLDTSNGASPSSYQNDLFPNLKNECVMIGTPEETPSPTPVPVGLHVGSSVTFSNGSFEFDASEGGTGSYSMSEIAGLEYPSSYSLSFDGANDVPATMWESAISVPDLLVVDGAASSLVLQSTTSSTISWTPVGADSVVLTFQYGTTGMCIVSDDGEFSVPLEFAQSIDPSGYFTAVAINESSENLNGRNVRLYGATGSFAYYSVGSAPAMK